ncbi:MULTISPECIES: esterase/lipase family protein [Streptomyces]|uniref:Alpha/beta fold hydrolase n=1 Tax=Streptomyces xinghaiensis TaxID=1038928 RepID=A0A3M8F171_9ACTN|nr:MULTISPECIES: alpha/beta fold hydrolase [Streptomyces]PQM21649.1 lipase [Streptomyces xinghaiensis]RKM94287.1 alpha/beta fold hydrolase [Streptomyces xinghaiensis]RNC71887.1 alpha/beta fold hydrolase [Streptomyces xinghaiensis]
MKALTRRALRALPRPSLPLPSLPASVLPPLPRPPSGALIRASVLELLVLAGHALLYPTGLTQERRTVPGLPGVAPAAEPSRAGKPRRSAAPGSPGSAGTRALPAEAAGPEPRTPSPLRPPASGPDRPPVLLLHGFIDNRSVFVLLRRSLRRHGHHQVEALNYSPLTCDIRSAAAALAERVEEICERTGRARIDVVGHSLGGLIARYYVQRLGGHARVRTLVTLGTPHSGTTAAPWLSAHPIIRQMRPDSPVIEELSAPAPECATRFVCFWSDLDQVVLPPATARIEHPDLAVVNIRVSGIGHLALPVHGAVAEEILRALDAPEANTDAGEAGSVA